MGNFNDETDIRVSEIRRHHDDLQLLSKAFDAAKDACDAEPLYSDAAKFHLTRMNAMSDMASVLRDRGETKTLTDKQREYARTVLGEPVYENLVSNNLAPRGKEVALPDVLKPENLPRFPPGRKK
jgi:hypothetical protein